jgi:hypothetical protein
VAKKPAPGPKKKPHKTLEPTTVASIDGISALEDCTLANYIVAVSAYVKEHASLTKGQKKAAQIRLSTILANALVAGLKSRLPQMGEVKAAEIPVSGALRIAKADVSEMNALDGLRLAIEIKPVNLAVGRAIWNRFGDIRSFAVNLHLKFPFAVVGGVLVIPTYEEKKQRSGGVETVVNASTVHLIQRAIKRLVRAGGRRTEGDAPHLLEGVGVVVYDPDQGVLHATIPAADSGLRWDDFITSLAAAYDSRFVSDAEQRAEIETAPDEDEDAEADSAEPA